MKRKVRPQTATELVIQDRHRLAPLTWAGNLPMSAKAFARLTPEQQKEWRAMMERQNRAHHPALAMPPAVSPPKAKTPRPLKPKPKRNRAVK